MFMFEGHQQTENSGFCLLLRIFKTLYWENIFIKNLKYISLRYTLIVDFFCSICDLKFVVQKNARKDMIKIGFLFTFGTSCFIIQMRKKGRLKLLKGWLCFSGMSLYALHRVIFNLFNFLALTYLWNFDKLKKYF